MIRIQVIRGKVGMTSVVDKIKEARLRLFRHVKTKIIFKFRNLGYSKIA